MLGCKAIDKFASLSRRIGNENGAGMFVETRAYRKAILRAASRFPRRTSRAKEREVVTKTLAASLACRPGPANRRATPGGALLSAASTIASVGPAGRSDRAIAADPVVWRR